MIRVSHRFALLFLREDGSLITQTPAEPDWEPVFEAARFTAARHGRLALADPVDGAIEPRWDAQAGAPYVAALDVELDLPGAPWRHRLPIACFRETARARAAALVESGELAAGERYRYVPVAYAEPDAARAPREGPVVEELPQELRVRDVALAARLATARPAGPLHADDVPVFVPAALIAEISAITRAADERETGGVLIGHVLRDTASTELGLEIVAQIPARAAEGTRSRLRFTPATWDDVARAVALRRDDSVWVGTWHSHPARAWCSQCPPERRPDCPMQRGFFSEHDRILHRVFPRAYSVAMVATDAEHGVRHSMFGWRHGVIQARGFHLTGAHDDVSTAEVLDSPSTGEPDACPDSIAR